SLSSSLCCAYSRRVPSGSSQAPVSLGSMTISCGALNTPCPHAAMSRAASSGYLWFFELARAVERTEERDQIGAFGVAELTVDDHRIEVLVLDATRGHQLDGIFELGRRAVIEVRRALGHVAQARRLERGPVDGLIGHLHAADVDLILGDL